MDDKQTYTYTLLFESDNRCEEAYEIMKESYGIVCIINNCNASSEIQTMLNHDTLEQVCT